MRFTIYVPENKRSLLKLLEKISALTGRSKSEIVVEALEKYLSGAVLSPLGRFEIGVPRHTGRADLYAGRLTKA